MGMRRRSRRNWKPKSKELLARAEVADCEPLPEGLSLPEELKRREDRLGAIRRAKAQIEARAAERDAQGKGRL